MEKNEFEILMLAITGLKSDLGTKIDKLEEKFEGRFEKFEGRFEKLEGRFEKFEGRFEKLEGKFDSLDNRMNEMSKDIRIIRDQTAQTVVKVTSLEHRVSALESPSA